MKLKLVQANESTRPTNRPSTKESVTSELLLELEEKRLELQSLELDHEEAQHNIKMYGQRPQVAMWLEEAEIIREWITITKSEIQDLVRKIDSNIDHLKKQLNDIGVGGIR